MIKKGRKIKLDLMEYRRTVELESIIESMAAAMRGAHMPYVAAYGRPTPNMERAMMVFYDWARTYYGKKA